MQIKFISHRFPGYKTANSEAGLRAFERDKADLLDLGVPIRYITPEEDDSLEDGGYVIDLKRFRMPEVRLTTDEVSALVLAASVARAMPGGAYPKIVDLALKKLAFDLPDLPDTPGAFPREAHGPRPAAPVVVHFPSLDDRRAPAAGRRRPMVEAGRHGARSRAAHRAADRCSLPPRAAAASRENPRDVPGCPRWSARRGGPRTARAGQGRGG